MNIKILVATHKKYDMPNDNCYFPIQVGKEGKKLSLDYQEDNTGDNISYKNKYYCELTGLYWGWKNSNSDYIGLAHYRRHFSNKNLLFRTFNEKSNCVLTDKEIQDLLNKYEVILPKKRKYYIETLYSHYAHTHYADHLDKTREIIKQNYNKYLNNFDKVMNQRSGYMFNMFIMKKELADEYCEWLFDILEKLEEVVDISQYDTFQARLFGRVSELLLNVWLNHKNLLCKEIPLVYMEKINWADKILSFFKAKFEIRKFENSF
ncbi:DUF4422 domain-containing protein [Clostridium butyricum]|uniref:DUF4422 domain-containing protein n=1 Tax=Clostridium butyricum TaxID=1492 RepID=UPI002ABE438D|nr:DUF4422 domain-containing protein [Clostridium butyricum]